MKYQTKATLGRPAGQKTNGTLGNTPIARLLRRLRLKNGMGLKDVAIASGVSVQFISNIEQGRAPLPLKMVSSVATILSVDEKKVASAVLRSSAEYRRYQELRKA